MTDLDRSIRRVRTALLLFGVPCAAALTGLAFHTEVSPLLDIPPEMLRVIAAPTGFLSLVSVMVGWRALRRTLRTQDEKLRGCIAELSLKRQELSAARAQHELEMKLKTQELEMRDDRIRIIELERALAQDRSDSENTGPTSASNRPSSSEHREPPISLNRPRKILRDATPATNND